MKPIKITFDNAEIRLISAILDQSTDLIEKARQRFSNTPDQSRYSAIIMQLFSSIVEEMEKRFLVKKRASSYNASLKVHEAVVLFVLLVVTEQEGIFNQSLCRLMIGKLEPKLN
ncbi:MAG: hypothetical protein AAF206_16140 [Bacteroidota bacterium]